MSRRTPDYSSTDSASPHRARDRTPVRRQLRPDHRTPPVNRSVHERLGVPRTSSGRDLRNIISQKPKTREEADTSEAQTARPQEHDPANDSLFADLQKQIDVLKARDNPRDFQAVRARNPFVLRIQQAVAPPKFRIPLIPLYGRGSDPDDHLHAFNLQMDIGLASDDFRCRIFAGTFEKVASQWYS